MRSKFETQTVRVHEARAAVSWLDHRDPFSNTMQQHLRCAPNVGRPLPGPASARRRCALRNPQGNAAEPAFASMESGTIQVMCPRGVRARRSTAARPRCRPPCRCTGCPRAGARGESPSPAPRTRGRRLLDDLAGREVEDDRRRALGVPDGGEDVEGGGEATGAASIQILSNLVSEHFPSRVNVSLGDERIFSRSSRSSTRTAVLPRPLRSPLRCRRVSETRGDASALKHLSMHTRSVFELALRLRVTHDLCVLR